MFKHISAKHSGLHFQNTISESEEFNILNFHYIYNGGGVGVGDFNEDGLADLVFSGNQTVSQIYLNQGDLKFLDITKLSNFNSEGWNTGVSIVDINADGRLDIYLSTGGLHCTDNCTNQLFINQGNNEKGIPQFTELAEAYGLSDGLYTQQAAFFDYDLDGDLDVYLLHNVIDKRDKNAPSGKQFINEKSKDQFLENQYSDSLGHPIFIDISDQVGIVNKGYGLGITINDFNEDGRPDIYITNDFLSDDLLYFNYKNKDSKTTFIEEGKKLLKHQSYNAMGVDAADINGDQRADIVVLDMLPELNERRKSMLGFMNYDKFQLAQKQNYAAQFIRNTLQLNNGQNGKEQLPFSEIGYLSGISATDWSWTPLLADFDNDGDRDLYVTNGYGKDITDLDFINYTAQSNAFGSKDEVMHQIYEQVRSMQNVEIPNYYFENEGDLIFKNKSKENTPQINSISNGAVYTDLDNDGDLDIVVNNINAKPFLLENNHSNQNNYLKIKMLGFAQNLNAVGATVTICYNQKTQKLLNAPVRGYLSSVDPVLHFGLGEAKMIDSLIVRYGTDRQLILKKIEVNQTLSIDLNMAERINFIQESKLDRWLEKQEMLTYTHKENSHEDYDVQPLLLRQDSRQGPCLAAANLDGKKGEELFIGGAKGEAGRIYQQTQSGTWIFQKLPDEQSEDTDADFFDADGDGDLDLYVVSGGSEFSAKDESLEDRLYINDGEGVFTKSKNKLIQKTSSGSCVVPFKSGDYQGRIFVGGRCVPRNFPATPQSQLFVEFQGKYISHSDKFANGLENIGMVNAAIAAPVNSDELIDLIIVGEWMEPQLFIGKGNHLEKKKITFLNEDSEEIRLSGLWRSVAGADLDQDGDIDFVLGNLGENTRLKASGVEPLVLYTGDYDQNGSKDPLQAQFYKNKNGERKLYPIHARDDVVKQLVKVKGEFLSYADFGRATFADILHKASKDDFLEVTSLKSMWIENLGDAKFRVHELPIEAQFSPINGILLEDIDKDGYVDILVTGNDYGSESNGGWQDASNGFLFKNNGKKGFKNIENSTSGFLVSGDGRDLIKLKDKDDNVLIIAGQNSGELAVFNLTK